MEMRLVLHVLVLYCVSYHCTRYVSGVTTESSENATVRETDTVKEFNVMKDNYHQLLKRVINNENEIEDMKSREEHLKHELETVKKYMTCQIEELNDITIENHDKLNDTKAALIKTRISFTQSLKLLNETMQELSHRQPEHLRCKENQTECNCTGSVESTITPVISTEDTAISQTTSTSSEPTTGTIVTTTSPVTSVEDDCYYRIDGKAFYSGTRSITASGITCQRWDSNSPHIPNYWPSGRGNKNYCRNPDKDDRPWCYTSDPETRWEYCGIDSCGIRCSGCN